MLIPSHSPKLRGLRNYLTNRDKTAAAHAKAYKGVKLFIYITMDVIGCIPVLAIKVCEVSKLPGKQRNITSCK